MEAGPCGEELEGRSVGAEPCGAGTLGQVLVGMSVVAGHYREVFEDRLLG